MKGTGTISGGACSPQWRQLYTIYIQSISKVYPITSIAETSLRRNWEPSTISRLSSANNPIPDIKHRFGPFRDTHLDHKKGVFHIGFSHLVSQSRFSFTSRSQETSERQLTSLWEAWLLDEVLFERCSCAAFGKESCLQLCWHGGKHWQTAGDSPGKEKLLMWYSGCHRPPFLESFWGVPNVKRAHRAFEGSMWLLAKPPTLNGFNPHPIFSEATELPSTSAAHCTSADRRSWHSAHPFFGSQIGNFKTLGTIDFSRSFGPIIQLGYQMTWPIPSSSSSVNSEVLVRLGLTHTQMMKKGNAAPSDPGPSWTPLLMPEGAARTERPPGCPNRRRWKTSRSFYTRWPGETMKYLLG